MKWVKFNHMTCIHVIDNSVVDYVISNIPIYIKIVKFDILNDHELDLDHRPLTPTLNFIIHKIPIEENSDNQST
jgi:hypothetical protein